MESHLFGPFSDKKGITLPQIIQFQISMMPYCVARDQVPFFNLTISVMSYSPIESNPFLLVLKTNLYNYMNIICISDHWQLLIPQIDQTN